MDALRAILVSGLDSVGNDGGAIENVSSVAVVESGQSFEEYCAERGLTPQQADCAHEWSDGVQEDSDGYDHEVAVYCLLCGLSGDI